jgi:glucosamine--fructose-6-phosphate aminotransferase (isomerizing)
VCGIVGYVGDRDCREIIVEGLRRLEYRGYDSAGIAIHDGKDVRVVRAVGKLARLDEALREGPPQGKLGIGHTRWATHGRPAEENAHPHRSGAAVVVHNGIIENHLALRRELEARGRVFQSETDTEIFAHLVDEELAGGARGDLPEAVRRAVRRAHGAYAIAVIAASDPDTIVAARLTSPLVVGLGEGENFLASDVPAVLAHTRRFIFMEDGELAVLRKGSVHLENAAGVPVVREAVRVDWTPVMAEKGGFKHFMLKEIHEQPRAVADTLRGRLSVETGDVFLDEVKLGAAEVAQLGKLVIVAAGTSYYAGLVGRYLIEDLARIPVEVDLASEFRYRNPIIGERDLCVAISQSGETLDTLAALREARRRGARVLAIVNVVGSTIARESDDVLYTHAGPEIGVASTKAFTAQLAALSLLAVYLGRRRGTLSAEHGRALLEGLAAAPHHIADALALEPEIIQLAQGLAHARDALYIARGHLYPIALEGALKLKEISYVHAEGYAGGELKHGPIALLDEDMPVVVLAPQNRHHEKILSNVSEVKARGAQVIALGTAGDDRLAALASVFLPLPACPESLEPLVTVVPLQLLAYHVADRKGTDVDQPRNLAKSVTVE